MWVQPHAASATPGIIRTREPLVPVVVLRRIGHEPWRQVPILGLAGERHRIDFVIPSRRKARRPPFLGPGVGLGVEIDSREFHEGAFERDPPGSRSTTPSDCTGSR